MLKKLLTVLFLSLVLVGCSTNNSNSNLNSNDNSSLNSNDSSSSTSNESSNVPTYTETTIDIKANNFNSFKDKVTFENISENTQYGNITFASPDKGTGVVKSNKLKDIKNISFEVYNTYDNIDVYDNLEGTGTPLVATSTSTRSEGEKTYVTYNYDMNNADAFKLVNNPDQSKFATYLTFIKITYMDSNESVKPTPTPNPNPTPDTSDHTSNDSTSNDSTVVPDPVPNPDLPDSVNAYYQGLNTSLSAGVLKNELHKIISNRIMTSYDDLWRTYKKADIRPDGKIMDIYSNTTNFRPGTDQAGSYQGEGDSYNREHTIPKSWWGGSKSNQGADPFIVFPSDGYVNNRRSSYPFGEVSNITYQSNNGYSKLGSSKFGGPSTVFEPADEWKGDMARVYFYAVTCYNTANWNEGAGSTCFSTTGNYGLTSYATKLFLKWHKEDPVSDWERQRNNAIFGINHNRNPYIDHPEFVKHIWGDVTF